MDLTCMYYAMFTSRCCIAIKPYQNNSAGLSLNLFESHSNIFQGHQCNNADNVSALFLNLQ